MRERIKQQNGDGRRMPAFFFREGGGVRLLVLVLVLVLVLELLLQDEGSIDAGCSNKCERECVSA